ncbi:MAG: hypothetical protein NT123_21790 [Proteobacteria bacterium]|nr:hypothetical protein [Pseudomonadota bacterium]
MKTSRKSRQELGPSKEAAANQPAAEQSPPPGPIRNASISVLTVAFYPKLLTPIHLRIRSAVLLILNVAVFGGAMIMDGLSAISGLALICLIYSSKFALQIATGTDWAQTSIRFRATVLLMVNIGLLFRLLLGDPFKALIVAIFILIYVGTLIPQIITGKGYNDLTGRALGTTYLLMFIFLCLGIFVFFR